VKSRVSHGPGGTKSAQTAGIRIGSTTASTGWSSGSAAWDSLDAATIIGLRDVQSADGRVPLRVLPSWMEL
jgi:hypothetical protein